MRTTINKTILAIVLVMMAINVQARTKLFMSTFYANGIRYDVLMVFNTRVSLYGESNYMRTAYYDKANNYMVVNQNLQSSSGNYNGRKYTTVKGYNPRFVTNNFGHNYNPDTYTFVYDDEDNLAEPPYEGDIAHMAKPVTSFRRVMYEELNYEFLRKFFVDGEPEFSALLRLHDMKVENEMAIATPPPPIAQAPDVMPPNTNGQRQLVLSNDTKNEITMSYAYFDNARQCWISVGWFNVMAYTKKTIFISDNTAKTFFVHAHDNEGNLWGGDNYFCTEKAAFNIPYADKGNCVGKKRFRPIVLNDVGETDYSFYH